jgi:hypothetical protein
MCFRAVIRFIITCLGDPQLFPDLDSQQPGMVWTVRLFAQKRKRTFTF